MVKFIALYAKPDDPTAFNSYYRETHLPLARKIPGLKRLELSRVKGAPVGEPRYYLMAELYFEDMAALKAGLGSPEGAAAGKDVMNFAAKLVHMMIAEVEEV